ncbi:MAG: Ribose transport system, periplasmic ribose-binding protein RbsB [Gemmataceae bacterium]|nr:Ribose transport system, periplasmic ribose-binding protein RbsB [Gemmataceae bacterium]
MARREFVMRPFISTPRSLPTPSLRLEELERRDTPTFSLLGPFTTGLSGPSVIAVGDFNRDGRADVAVGNQGGGPGGAPSVSILLGNGDGSFTAAPSLTSPLLSLPRSIVVADFNGDGVPDLAVGSFDPNQSGAPGSTLVFLGKGDGTFGPPTFQQPLPAIALGAGDFTGDGVPDLIVVSPSDAGSFLHVFRGNGAGSFAPAAAPQFVPLTVNRVAVADFNGDGLLDVAGLDAGPTGPRIVTLYGSGKGTFAQPVFTPLGKPPTDLVAGDFDGDGKVDLVVAEGNVAVFHKNLGGQVFAAGTPVLTTGPAIDRLAAADFDGNGLPDVVAVASQEVRVATSLGGGAFAADPGNPYTTPGVWAGTDVATGDVDGDGNPDVVVVRRGANGTGDQGQVLLNLDPDFTRTVLSTAPNPSGENQPVRLTAAVAPVVPPFPLGPVPTGTVTFFGDGLVLGTAPLANGTATFLVPGFAAGTHQLVARYSGDAAFRPSSSPPVAQVVVASGRVLRYEVTGLPTGPGSGADRVASGAFTPDGVPDIVIGSGVGRPARVTVIDGQTRQVLAETQPFEDGFTGGVFVAAGDLDGDGIADLVVVADEGGGPRVRVYLTRGNKLVPAADFLALDPTFRGGLRVALGDVNHDGVADLVVTGGPGAGPRVAIYDGRSLLPGMTPTRLQNDFFALDPTFRGGLFVAVGNVNGDGFGELVIGTDVGGGPRVRVFDGASLAAGVPVVVADFFSGPVTDRGGVRVAVRDVDGDGYAEILTGSGPGSGSRVRIYNGVAAATEPNPVPFFETDAFPGLTSGVYVA